MINGDQYKKTTIQNSYTTGAAVGEVNDTTYAEIANCYATAKTVDVGGITVTDEAGLKK